MMDYKEETTKVYDRFPEYFDEKFESYLNYAKKNFDKVISFFPENAKILDLGSGIGNHALYLKERGFDVICADISNEMLNICKKKGLKTIKMDLEKIDFPSESFDVVWAYTSLLHLQKKNIENVLKDIKNILKKEGLFFVGFKEGREEGFVEFKEWGRRWFSLFEHNEVVKLLEKDFQIIDSWKIHIEGKTFLDYLCRKRYPR